MLNKFFIIIIFFLPACGPRSGISDQEANSKQISNSPDSNQVKYFRNVLTTGARLFKKSCASCHCIPPSNCEPGGVSFVNIFKELPMDSLLYYETFIRNSPAIKKNEFAPHEFGKTLPDSSIKIVIEYLWLTSQ